MCDSLLRRGPPADRLPPGPLREIFLQYYGHLDPGLLPYFFTNDNQEFLQQWRQNLYEVLFPCASIPYGLKLVKGTSLQPPRFVFGWAFEPVTIYRIMLRIGFPPKRMFRGSGFAHPFVDGEDGTAYLRQFLEARFPRLVEEMGAVMLDQVVAPREKGVHEELWKLGLNRQMMCLTLADSYLTGNRTPRLKNIAMLQKLFGIGQVLKGEEGTGDGFEHVIPLKGIEPMWYVDWEQRDWELLNSKSYAKEHSYRGAYGRKPIPARTFSTSSPNGAV